VSHHKNLFVCVFRRVRKISRGCHELTSVHRREHHDARQHRAETFALGVCNTPGWCSESIVSAQALGEWFTDADLVVGT
jgi:hypothetical protein